MAEMETNPTSLRERKSCVWKKATSEGKDRERERERERRRERERVMQEMQACKFRPRMLSWICANLSWWIMNAMVKTERTRANAVASLCYCVTFGWVPWFAWGGGGGGGGGGGRESSCVRLYLVLGLSQVSVPGEKREVHVTTDCGKPSRCIRAENETKQKKDSSQICQHLGCLFLKGAVHPTIENVAAVFSPSCWWNVRFMF